VYFWYTAKKEVYGGVYKISLSGQMNCAKAVITQCIMKNYVIKNSYISTLLPLNMFEPTSYQPYEVGWSVK